VLASQQRESRQHAVQVAEPKPTVASLYLHIYLGTGTYELDVLVVLDDDHFGARRIHCQQARHSVKVLVAEPSMGRLDPRQLGRVEYRACIGRIWQMMHGYQSGPIRWLVRGTSTAVTIRTEPGYPIGASGPTS
jgi:hypothetical protein